MHIKIYVPKTVEIPNEYLPPLAQRAHDSLGEAAKGTPATRGHLVRQAIRDGLLRELDTLIAEDGSVDVVCDPHKEVPLEIDNRTLTLGELLVALSNKRTFGNMKQEEFEDAGNEASVKIFPRRRAA